MNICVHAIFVSQCGQSTVANSNWCAQPVRNGKIEYTTKYSPIHSQTATNAHRFHNQAITIKEFRWRCGAFKIKIKYNFFLLINATLKITCHSTWQLPIKYGRDSQEKKPFVSWISRITFLLFLSLYFFRLIHAVKWKTEWESKKKKLPNSIHAKYFRKVRKRME